jgi:thiaminase/transcriptional activator TenA
VLCGNFTGELWRSIVDVYGATISHPFIEGLTDGTLRLDVFREYVVQDALYLSRFSRALSLLGAKAPDDDTALLLLSAGRDTLLVERASLHEFLLKEWGIGPDKLVGHTMSPTNRAYTDFLVSTVYEEPFLVGLSAVLPCFWVYLEVGKELLKRGSPNPTYRRWIMTYSSPDYEALVAKVLGVTNRAAEHASSGELRSARRAFRLSTIYEYMFWDSAYRRVGWPLDPLITDL